MSLKCDLRHKFCVFILYIIHVINLEKDKKMKITATANYSAQTFTIRKTDGEFKSKYRTIRLSKDEFNSCLHNTENDWKQFLKSDDYYVV